MPPAYVSSSKACRSHEAQPLVQKTGLVKAWMGLGKEGLIAFGFGIAVFVSHLIFFK